MKATLLARRMGEGVEVLRNVIRENVKPKKLRARLLDISEPLVNTCARAAETFNDLYQRRATLNKGVEEAYANVQKTIEMLNIVVGAKP